VSTRVWAVVAARNEADRIGATVSALFAIPSVEAVVVADDGSSDGTSGAALEVGARVVRSRRNKGKGAALSAAVDVARAGEADVVLLADGDLGSSASALDAVLRPVLAGSVDLAVAIPPRPPTGGFGLVRRMSSALVQRASGFHSSAPLSGQRAVTMECLRACRPLADGFGVDAAMLADAARLGFRVVEVPAEVTHRFSGRDLAGFRHRARQGAQILRALAPRAVGWR
jgi:glycosyltransferase involved in cell wall biosynthesis